MDGGGARRSCWEEVKWLSSVWICLENLLSLCASGGSLVSFGRSSVHGERGGFVCFFIAAGDDHCGVGVAVSVLLSMGLIFCELAFTCNLRVSTSCFIL